MLQRPILHDLGKPPEASSGPSYSESPQTVLTEGFYQRYFKRAFDFVVSLAALVLVSPLLLIFGLLVRLSSRGPTFFRQIRLGRDGRPFRVIKFRTMREGAEKGGPTVVVPGDERLTAVGGFLRRTKLDELPQLFNALRGDMSLVGPRPRVPEEVDLSLPEERALLIVRPGLTSYASLYHRVEAEYCSQHEDPGHAHRLTLLPQKTYLDSEYVKNLSFALDLKLIFLTAALVFIPGTARPKVVKFFGLEIHPHGRLAQMVLDAAIFACAAWLAYWLRYEHQVPADYHWQRVVVVIVLPLLRLAANQRFGIYRMIWRYVNLSDATMLAMSLGVVSGVLLFLRAFLPSDNNVANYFQIPLTVIAMEYLLSSGACLGLRGLRRMLYEMGHRYQPLPGGRKSRVLILGAGFSGLGIALEMARLPHLEVVGFADDDPAKQGRLIAGFGVLGTCDHAADLIRQYDVQDVILCIPSSAVGRIRFLTDQCRSAGAQVHLVPGIDQILKTETERAAAAGRVAAETTKVN